MPFNLMAPIFDNALDFGNAYVLLGPPDVAFDQVPNWQEIGAIGGAGQFHPQPKHLTLPGGSPATTGAVGRVSDDYSFEFECYELNINNIILKYGYDGGANPGTMNPQSTEPLPSAYADSTPVGYPTTGDTVDITGEAKIFYGYNWFHLLGRNLTAAAVTGMQGLTTLTEWDGTSGDFQVDRRRGFIRRVPGGQIIPGEPCTFDYVKTSPPQGIVSYKRGLSTHVPKYAAKFCVPTSDTTATVYDCYKGYFESTEPVTYDVKEFRKMKMMFKGMPDFTRLQDEGIMWDVNEEVWYLATPTP